MTYPASLRQQAAWIREALDPATPDTQRITLGDVDVEELEAAADRIEQLEERMRGAEALIVLWETRATRAEAEVEKWHRVAMEAGAITCSDGRHIYPRRERIEQLEKHKRLQTEDIMNLGAQLGQALRKIDEAVLAEREACAAIAAKRPHHSGIEIAELIRNRSDT
jgi:hypothetical protein